MKCPVCSEVDLQATSTPKHVDVHCCPGCGGLWADPFWIFANRPVDWNHAAKRPSALTSPRTGKPMVVIEALDGRAPVHTEDKGAGAWFGKRELALLTSSEAGEPWLEHAIDEPDELRRLGNHQQARDALATTLETLSAAGGWPSRGACVRGFLSSVGAALRIAVSEKEILVFALLQLPVVAGFYVLWAEGIDWLTPPGSGPPHLPLMIIWSAFAALGAFMALGLLSGSMGAAHLLRRQGQASTIAACLAVVWPRKWALMAVLLGEAYIGAVAALHQLPAVAGGRAMHVGAPGVLPGVIAGSGFDMAHRRAYFMGRHWPEHAIALRSGYATVCWTLGVALFVASFCVVYAYPEVLPRSLAMLQGGGDASWLRRATVPVLAGIGAVLLLPRPVYVIACTDLYADFVDEQHWTVTLPPPPSRIQSAEVALGLLLLLAGVVYLYRHELGPAELPGAPAAEQYRVE